MPGVAADDFRRLRTSAPELVAEARRRVTAQRDRMSRAGLGGDPDVPHYIVCGDEPLTFRLVEELAGRYKRRIVGILRSKPRNPGPDLKKINGVEPAEAER